MKGVEKEGQFKRGYYMGCVLGIHHRLSTEQRNLDSSSATANAMVLQRRGENREAVAKYYPQLGRLSKRMTASAFGKSQGYEDGKNLSLRKGVETRERRLIE